MISDGITLNFDGVDGHRLSINDETNILTQIREETLSVDVESSDDLNLTIEDPTNLLTTLNLGDTGRDGRDGNIVQQEEIESIKDDIQEIRECTDGLVNGQSPVDFFNLTLNS